MKLHERIFELALTRSFFYPSNEPYDAPGGFYDYGPVGTLLKKKVQNLWRRMFIKKHGYHEIEGTIITPEMILKASGHVDGFADPIAECKNCKTKVRADSFVADNVNGFEWDGTLPSLDKELKNLKCPSCKGEFAPAKMFNLMFSTGIGGEETPAYCRPETAQGIFTAFPRLFRNHGAKLPLAVGQIGRSFRNEISPRKGLVRMREFTQMELEYFFNPDESSISEFSEISKKKMRFSVNGKILEKTIGEAVKDKTIPNEIMGYFIALEWDYYLACGIPEKNMYFRVLPDTETPHYSKRNIDLEVETSYGVIEVNGNAYRTDFDLSRHSEFSGKDFSVFVEKEKRKIMPHVFEASLGVDRLLFSILENTFREKTKEKDWEWFDFPPAVAPYHCAIFPLMKKEGLPEKAKEVYDSLLAHFDVLYQESGSIGRRYARADEIGTPYAITVDYDTLKDDTVTLRYRNDGKQERIKIPELEKKLHDDILKNKVKM